MESSKKPRDGRKEELSKQKKFADKIDDPELQKAVQRRIGNRDVTKSAKDVEIPSFFKNDKDAIKFFREHELSLKTVRREKSKFTDGHSFGMVSFRVNKSGDIVKADEDLDEDEKDSDTMTVRCVINATNILDSHRDVHIPGLWKRSLGQKPQLFLVQEHDLSFKGIISDEVKAFTQMMSFKALGFNFPGEAECLIFDCVIHKDRNTYMFDQYAKKRVKNHSVRMRPVKEYFCYQSNEPDATQWNDNWNKYAPMVANQDDLKSVKWFYAVTEAKIIAEGSAVVIGSCFTTPTLEIEKYTFDPSDDTQKDNQDPPDGTPKTAWDLFKQKGKFVNN